MPNYLLILQGCNCGTKKCKLILEEDKNGSKNSYSAKYSCLRDMPALNSKPLERELG